MILWIFAVLGLIVVYLIFGIWFLRKKGKAIDDFVKKKYPKVYAKRNKWTSKLYYELTPNSLRWPAWWFIMGPKDSVPGDRKLMKMAENYRLLLIAFYAILIVVMGLLFYLLNYW
ncbi:hypothetical protein KY328_01475 [Candidatus Woesearchaeota archaeon]|nr:hypothetical protein [Candidatus Woesearchaeota archaeon]